MKSNAHALRLLIVLALLLAPGAIADDSAAPPAPSPKDSLMKALRAQQAAKSYRKKTYMDSGKGPELQMCIEFAAPDRFHVVRTKDEGIVIGDTTYAKPNGQPWAKAPFDLAPALHMSLDPQTVDKQADRFNAVTIAGQETLDGVPTTVYTYTNKHNDRVSTAKIWVGTNDGLPHKIQNINTGGLMDMTLTITYEYDPTIQIAAPLP